MLPRLLISLAIATASNAAPHLTTRGGPSLYGPSGTPSLDDFSQPGIDDPRYALIYALTSANQNFVARNIFPFGAGGLFTVYDKNGDPQTVSVNADETFLPNGVFWPAGCLEALQKAWGDSSLGIDLGPNALERPEQWLAALTGKKIFQKSYVPAAQVQNGSPDVPEEVKAILRKSATSPVVFEYLQSTLAGKPHVQRPDGAVAVSDFRAIVGYNETTGMMKMWSFPTPMDPSDQTPLKPKLQEITVSSQIEHFHPLMALEDGEEL